MAELGSWQTVEPRGRAPYRWAALLLCPAPVPTAASLAGPRAILFLTAELPSLS